MKPRVWMAAVVAVVLGSEAGGATAATVTIGPQSLQSPTGSIGCAVSPCSRLFANPALVSPGGRLSAPADGVITSWGLIGTEGDPGGTLQLRVLRPVDGGLLAGAGTSAAAARDSPGVYGGSPNATSLTVRIGDRIGVTADIPGGVSGAPSEQIGYVSNGAAFDFWMPSLLDGESRAPSGSLSGELQFNATEELAVPVISGLEPSSGPTGAGAHVTISGDHLAGASAVTFGATPAGIISNTNTQIVAQAPSSVAGAVDVHVTTIGGTSAASPGDIYTYAGAPAPPPRATIATLAATNRIFAVGPAATARDGVTLAALSHARGTTFTFTLDQAAFVTIAVQRRTAGRDVRGKCRRSTSRLRRKKRCTRYVSAGMLRRAAHPGHNSVPFTGRIGRTPLKPANYRARFTATTVFGPSRVKALTFRIVRR